MEQVFKLDQFEGPLDLLLHLIKKDNISIYDINLSKLTNQYLNFIRNMEVLNLDIASEYLVMAAELIELKSKSLLPKDEFNTEDDYEEDPREQLIKRLIDYKQYKEIAEKFKEFESNRSGIYTKIPEQLVNYIDKKEIMSKYNITMDDLLEAMDKFIEKNEYKKPLDTTITKKEISIIDKIKEIKSILKTKKEIDFKQLFSINTKSEIISVFLAILELTRKKHIIIFQEGNFENIIIRLKEV